MELTLALDWTPNVNHAGLYLAQIKGYYKELGIDPRFISTDIDAYRKKPIQRLADHEVDLAIGPSEHLIEYRLLREDPVPVVAMATVSQHETSAFVTLQSSGITRPAQLDGKTYAGYKTLLETNLITEMIRNDGGKGDISLITPPRLSVFDGFLQGEADTCWVFVPWEVAIAENRGIPLYTFYLNDFQVPYGYSPLIMSREEIVTEKKEAIHNFFKATAKGYREAAAQPEATARLLVEHIDHSNFEDIDFIELAMHSISGTLLNNAGQWGVMRYERWRQYTHWLIQKKMLAFSDKRLLTEKEADVTTFYSNDFLN